MKRLVWNLLVLWSAVGWNAACVEAKDAVQVDLRPAAANGPDLQLKAVRCDTRILGPLAATVLTKTYSHASPGQEVQFDINSGDNTAVTGFAYWYHKEKVVARIVATERAENIYRAITTRRRDPALVVMKDPHRFSARIFPLVNGEDLKVEITSVSVVPRTSRGMTWRFRDGEAANILTGSDDDSRSGNAKSLPAMAVNLRYEELPPLAEGGEALPVGDDGLLWDAAKLPRAATGTVQWNGPQNASPSSKFQFWSGRRAGNEGFFVLTVHQSATRIPIPVSEGPVQLQSVYMLKPDADAGSEITTFVGRYRGSGRSQVTIGGQRLAVDFSSQRREDNMAAPLWARCHLDRLSNQAGQSGKVMELSVQYGMPTRWTSWLAVPTAEREAFVKPILQAELGEAYLVYARAMGRGEWEQARAAEKIARARASSLKVSVDLKSPLVARLEELLREGPGYGTEAKEIARLRAMGVKVSEQYKERLAREDELDRLREILVREVEMGRPGGTRFAAAYRQAEKIGQKNGHGFGKWEIKTAGRMAELLRQINARRLAGRGQDEVSRALRQRLYRLEQFGWQYNASLASLRWDAARELAAKVAAARLTPGFDGAQRRALEAQFARLWLTDWERENVIKAASTPLLQPQLHPLVEQTAREIAEGKIANPATQANLARCRRLLDKTLDSAAGHALDEAVRLRAHELALRIVKASAQVPAPQAEIEKLNAELKLVSRARLFSRADPYAYLGQHSVQEDIVRAAETDFRVLDERGMPRFRPGDPLISIDLPQTCRRVVAVLPDGTVKELRWSPLQRRWQARFDVSPDWPEGVHRIVILVVDAAGKRTRLEMPFQVDTQAPEGHALARKDGEVVEFHFEGDADTDHVTVIVPGAAPIELARSSTGFSGSVPLALVGQSQSVELLVTDRAHNTARMKVEILP